MAWDLVASIAVIAICVTVYKCVKCYVEHKFPDKEDDDD